MPKLLKIELMMIEGKTPLLNIVANEKIEMDLTRAKGGMKIFLLMYLPSRRRVIVVLLHEK